MLRTTAVATRTHVTATACSEPADPGQRRPRLARVPRRLPVAPDTSTDTSAGTSSTAPESGAAATQARAGRDRYIDTLRALALGRVIAYHVTGWVLLPIIFPSMGIMFALAGSLMAASLDRSPHNPWPVLRKRMRRLLPPLWALGAVLVTLMLTIGWEATEELGTEFSWSTLLFWLVPVVDPPFSVQGAEWVVPLWYIRAYLWFVLSSPVLLWCFRRWPLRTFAAPLVVLLGYGAGLVTLNGAEGDIVLDWAVFGACWILGFAHHDGLIRRIPMTKILPVAAAFLGSGLAWAALFPDPILGHSVADIPVADGLYCLGFVLILLRFYPDFAWIARFRWLDMLITAMNRRAMTIYLWGNACIFAALALLEPVAGLEDVLAEGNLAWIGIILTLSWVLIWLAVLAFGWVEDVAAKRPVHLLPLPRRTGRRTPSTSPHTPEAQPRAAIVSTDHQESSEYQPHPRRELQTASS